jgi:hypothetical protein
MKVLTVAEMRETVVNAEEGIMDLGGWGGSG